MQKSNFINVCHKETYLHRRRNRRCGQKSNKRVALGNITSDTKVGAFEYIHAMCNVLLMRLYKEQKDLELVDTLLANSPYEAMIFYHYIYRIHQYNRQLRLTGSGGFSRIKKIQANQQTLSIAGKDWNFDHKMWELIFGEVSAGLGETKAAKIFTEYHQIVCLCNLFYERSRELKLGPDHWLHSKVNSQAKKYNSASFGLSPQYRHYASGLSWDENMRSTLSAYTSGIAHLAILSVNKGEAKYLNKHVVAANRAFSFIQHIKSVTEVVKSNSVQVNKKIVEQMCQITATKQKASVIRPPPPEGLKHAQEQLRVDLIIVTLFS